MSQFSEFLNNNLLSIVFSMSALVIILLILTIFLINELNKLKKRYETFTGGKRHPDYNMETQFKLFHSEAKKLEEKYENLSHIVKDMDKSINKSIQKIGVVRYNPFDEFGGNLCYAVALLDCENNGVVLNGIHSRSGCFTYAKEIELGVSKYVLSEEELEALKMAKDNSYTKDRNMETINELEKRYPKVYGENASEKNYDNNYDSNEAVPLENVFQTTSNAGEIMAE